MAVFIASCPNSNYFLDKQFSFQDSLCCAGAATEHLVFNNKFTVIYNNSCNVRPCIELCDLTAVIAEGPAVKKLRLFLQRMKLIHMAKLCEFLHDLKVVCGLLPSLKFKWFPNFQ